MGGGFNISLQGRRGRDLPIFTRESDRPDPQNNSTRVRYNCLDRVGKGCDRDCHSERQRKPGYF